MLSWELKTQSRFTISVKSAYVWASTSKLNSNTTDQSNLGSLSPSQDSLHRRQSISYNWFHVMMKPIDHSQQWSFSNKQLSIRVKITHTSVDPTLKKSSIKKPITTVFPKNHLFCNEARIRSSKANHLDNWSEHMNRESLPYLSTSFITRKYITVTNSQLQLQQTRSLRI